MASTIQSYRAARKANGLLLFLILLVLVISVLTWILTGASQLVIFTGIGIALLVMAVAILKDWRSGVYAFIAWLLFADLVRKYLGNNVLLFFGQDVLAAAIFVSLFLAKGRRQVAWFRAPFLMPLAALVGLAAIQIFNPGSPSILYGLLGMKLYFLYVPMMYAGYALLENGEDLQRFLLFNLALGAVIAGLGIAQSVLGLRFLNPVDIAPELQGLTSVVRGSAEGGAVPAVTSIFASSGRFSAYIIFLVILGMGTPAYLLLRRRRAAVWAFAALAIALVAAMQSGSRGSIMFSLISMLAMGAGFLWGAPWHWAEGHRLVKAVRRALLVAAFGLLAMLQLFPRSIGASWNFYYDTLSPTSENSELGYRAWDYPLGGLESAFRDGTWLLGQGTGTSSLGTYYVAAAFNEPGIALTSAESGFGTLIKEMGILGAVLWLIFSASLLTHAWKAVKRTRRTMYFPVAFAIFWYAFLLLVPLTIMTISDYENYVMNAYFWILIGMLFRLPHLAQVREVAAPRTLRSHAVPGREAVAALKS
jgi:hypothetical protein